MHRIFFHPEMCFGLTYVILGQSCDPSAKFFLLCKEKRKSREAETEATQEKSACFHFIWLTTLENDQRVPFMGVSNVYLQRELSHLMWNLSETFYFIHLYIPLPKGPCNLGLKAGFWNPLLTPAPSLLLSRGVDKPGS